MHTNSATIKTFKSFKSDTEYSKRPHQRHSWSRIDKRAPQEA